MRSIACALGLVISCTVACTKAGGIELDVTAGSNVDEVRVYVGLTQVAPALSSLEVPMRAEPNGSDDATIDTSDVFVRDPDIGSDVLPYTGQPLHFELESAGKSSIGAVLVMGFANHQPVAGALKENLMLSPHQVDRFAIDLSEGQDATRLFAWGPLGSDATPAPAPDDTECVGLVNGTQQGFIVDGDDYDCDGWTNNSQKECEAEVYDAGSSITMNGCVMQTQTSFEVACVLGGGECIDGRGIDGSDCESLPGSPACVVTGACHCGSDDVACVLDELAADESTAMPPAAAYDCNVGDAPFSSNCAIELPRPPTGGYGCVPNAGGIWNADDDKFENPVSVAGANYYWSVGSDCNIELDPHGNAPTGSNAAMLVQVVLDDPSNTSVVIPVVLSSTGGGCTPGSNSPSIECSQHGLGSDLVMATCAAGWSTPREVMGTRTGSDGSTSTAQISGTSPTLDDSMTSLYYITPDGIEYATRGSSSDAVWTIQGPIEFTYEGLGSSPAVMPLAIHLNGSGDIMWIVANVSSFGNIVLYATKGSNGWNAELLEDGLTLSDPVDYAPADPDDNPPHDAIMETSDRDLSEVANLMTDTAEIGTGDTPFLSGDGTTMWFSSPGIYNPVGSNQYTMYVESRIPGQAFAPCTIPANDSGPAVGPVQLPELGTSSYPQWPWVSPNGSAIYFTQGSGSAQDIYFSTR